MSATYHLQVSTDLNHLNQILTWADQINHTLVPNSHWLQCKIAIAEGFTNAVRHAHKILAPHTPIEIEIEIDPQQIVIQIWDYGPPFDLLQYLDTLPERSDQYAEGGRGLQLIKKVADELNYERIDHQRNCLSIVKYISETTVT